MALSNKDVQKLLDVGFAIIREDQQRFVIKRKTYHRREWHTWEKDFKSKAELRRRMDAHLKCPKIIED